MLHIEARDYSAYKYECSISGEMLDPIKYKMLHGDTCEDGKPIYCSPWRTQPVPGIIILGKTYGSWKGKLLYKFIPDCKHLPFFLVPYELKASFSKAHKNKFAVITFKEWTLQSTSSFPLGTLTETIGDVDSLEAFCEYQLHRRNLVVSMNKFTNRVKSILADEKACIKTILETSKYNIQDYRNQKYIFSIDPDSCTDFDDAFSVSCENGVATVTVYIANVYVWLETFGLFAYLTNRVSTIYLPDKKRPMLPSLLSDNYCSLKQGCERFAFAYQQQYNMDSLEPVSEPRLFNAIINVNKNCTYEDPNLNKMPGYAALKTLSGKEDSHDVVAHWMIKMNVECAKVLTKGFIAKGIYRGSESMRASYSLEPMRHDALNETVYTHITSPIRRLVDVLNQICFNANVSADAAEFYNTWSLNLNHVNAQTKAIKRAQMDCDLLAFSMNHNESECIGTIVDILDDGEYCVQLHTNRCMVRYKSAEIYDTGSQHTFKILVFSDEHTLCKKVRIEKV
jgi:exoribonuclease R